MTAAQRSAVLVVEDEVLVQQLVVEILADAGFATEAVPDGRAALACLAPESTPRDRYRAIVLDLMLPNVSGLEVLRHIQEHRLGIPVVAISASRPLLSEAILAGADVTLAKPFAVDQLLSIVGAYSPR